MKYILSAIVMALIFCSTAFGQNTPTPSSNSTPEAPTDCTPDGTEGPTITYPSGNVTCPYQDVAQVTITQPVRYPHTNEEARYQARWKKAHKKCGRCSGRNIAKYGYKGKKGVRRATFSELRKSNKQLKKLYAPVPYYLKTVAVPPPQPPSGVATASVVSRGGSSNPMVNPQCESGGNPQATGNPGYWGKYQFDSATWKASGGNPATYGSASEAEQDRVAANVKYDAWPNC